MVKQIARERKLQKLPLSCSIMYKLVPSYTPFKGL